MSQHHFHCAVCRMDIKKNQVRRCKECRLRICSNCVTENGCCKICRKPIVKEYPDGAETSLEAELSA